MRHDDARSIYNLSLLNSVTLPSRSDQTVQRIFCSTDYMIKSFDLFEFISYVQYIRVVLINNNNYYSGLLCAPILEIIVIRVR